MRKLRWISDRHCAAKHLPLFVDTQFDRSLTTPALRSATLALTVPARMATTAPSEANIKAPFPMDRHPVNSPPSTTVSLSPPASERNVSGESKSRIFIPYTYMLLCTPNLGGRVGRKKGTAAECALYRRSRGGHLTRPGQGSMGTDNTGAQHSVFMPSTRVQQEPFSATTYIEHVIAKGLCRVRRA